jgi:acetoin utilization deacetylase AcuC-like enzyme
MATMDRVCPFCGEPAGAGVFCAACGRNLAAVERLPTRAEWESGGAARIDPEPDAVADPDAGAVSDAAAGAVPLAERCAQATAAFLTAMRAAGCPGATRTQMAKRSTFRPGGKAHGWVVRPVDRDDDVKPRRYEPGLLLTTEASSPMCCARTGSPQRRRPPAPERRGDARGLGSVAMAHATGWVWDERYAWHDARGMMDSVGPEALFEPEPSLESGATKRRLRNLVEASGLLGRLESLAPRAAGDDVLEWVHDPAYLDRVRAESAGGGGDAGGWSPFGRGTFEIAALAVGGCLTAVDAVLDGRVRNAYALVRPPGHHAGPDGGCGYCVFSNVALAALHLRRARGLERVAIVDWDVHHGNGTEAVFASDPSVLAISLHQEDLFPAGSGRVDDVGDGAGAGTTINVPLPAGAGRAAYLAAFDRVVRPALDRFAPDFVLVACGLDASMNDPLGRMNLTSECFALLTDRVMAAAQALCGGRLVLCHEGGYSSAYVPYCGLAIVERLAGIRTGVVDPWLDDGRAILELPLRDHEAAAVAAAARVASAPWPRSS